MTCLYRQPVDVPKLKTLACISFLELKKHEIPLGKKVILKDIIKTLFESEVPKFVQTIRLLLDPNEVNKLQVTERFEKVAKTMLDNNSKTSPTEDTGGLGIISEELNMKLEENRLKSFRSGWPLSYIKPSELAAVGLFYLGFKDHVQCVFCKGTISEWAEGDSPLKEHARHFPFCPFLSHCDVGNIPLRGLNGMQNWQTQQSRPECSNHFRPVSQRPPVGFKPVYSAMGSFDKRLETFKSWSSQVLSAKELAESGFFYSGISDVVTCFCCGGSLGNWTANDKAWTEHAKHFPSCVYIKCIKGSQFLESVRNSSATSISSSQPSACSEVLEPVENTSEVPVTAATNAVEQLSKPEVTHTCKICMDESPRVAFSPCGHSLACPKCASNLSTCPLCRKKIESTLRIYFD